MSARPLIVGLGWLDAPGGLERYVADLRAELGDPATIVLSGIEATPPGLIVAARADASLSRRWRAVRRAARVAAPDADVVDLHFALTGIAALSSRAVRRLPKIIHFQGPWADEAADARLVRRVVERIVYRNSQRVVVLSGSMARIVIERYGVAPWKVDVIPPGVDLRRFSPGDRQAARRRYGVPDDAFLAVSVRRLVPRTGIHVLLDAWAMAAVDLPVGATLLIAGDGPRRVELEEQLRRLAPGRSGRLLGTISDDDLVDLYRAADVAVVPSVALEGFGLVALESLACGTPTVVSRCGGLPDAVAGLGSPIVAPGDVDALAATLVSSAGGPPPDRSRCRNHAEGFGWPVVAARHRQLYEDAAGRRPPAERRVVLIDHSAARSGGEVAMARLAAATPGTRFHAILFEEGPFEEMLARAGATVEVRALGQAGAVNRATAGTLRIALRHGARAALSATSLAWRLRRLRPEVVHANSLKAGIIGGVAARLAGVPMVWHLRDRLADDYLPRRTASLVRAAVRHLSVAVIVPSEAVLETLGPPGRRIRERVVIPDPYRAEPRPAPRSSRAATRPLHVVMVGRLAPWKGQDVFLRAFAAAFPHGDERATIVGAPLFGADEEVYADGLAGLLDDLGLGGRVDLLGERDDVADLLDLADVVVHASRIPEPFGQVVVEGMAAGAAVIATAGGGPSELVRDGVDGILVPAGDIDAMATALRALATDPERRLRLGGSAQTRAAELTDPERIGALVAGIHERASRTGRQRG